MINDFRNSYKRRTEFFARLKERIFFTSQNASDDERTFVKSGFKKFCHFHFSSVCFGARDPYYKT